MGRREAHAARQAALSQLGRHLARRARSRCEICGASEGLSPTPTQQGEEPDLDNVLLLCDRCARVLRGERIEAPDTLRFLEEVVWAEEPLVQAVAIRMLERVDTPWAAVTRENLWVDEETRGRVDALDP